MTSNVMSEAIKVGNKKVVESLLNRGYNVNHKIDPNGLTYLHLAAEYNQGPSHYDVIKALLKIGADVNGRDRYGNTPLHYLMWYAGVEVVRLFLDSKADVNVRNSRGETALWPAIRSFNSKIVRLLIDQGLDVNCVNNDGITPLHEACTSLHQSPEIIKLLLKKSENVEVVILKYLHTSETCMKIHLNHADANHVDPSVSKILRICYKSNFWKSVIEHFAKLQALSLPIHATIIEIISNTEEYGIYFLSCKEELESAKGAKLENCWVTYFNLLVDSEQKVKNYAGNRDLIQEFLKIDCVKKFPIYGSDMLENVEKGMNARKLFDESSITLSNNLPIFNPNHLIIRDVLDCLTKEDYFRLSSPF